MRIIVIGAGPAGSLASILLARGGASVTLIERSQFPRHKVCGECLSALGRQVLRRHGLEAPLAACGVELTRTRLFAGDASALLPLPQPMLGISRSTLDVALIDAAAAAGARVLQPARVESVESSDIGVRTRVRRIDLNVLETLDTDLLVAANGAAVFAGEKPLASGDMGIKTHFRNVRADPSAITLFAAGGCYGGLAPIEGGRWNAAFSVPAERLRNHGGDVGEVFQALKQASEPLAQALAEAQIVEPWLAAPLPRYAPRRDWPAHCIPVGNAAAAIEPIGGEGMGLALRSAELAAEAILTDRLHTLNAAYARLWATRRIGCRLAARVVSDATFGAAALDLLQSSTLSGAAMALIGKTFAGAA